MDENKSKDVVESTAQVEQPKIDNKVEKLKVKKKPKLKKFSQEDDIVKIDLTNQPEENADTKQSTDEVSVRDGSETSKKVSEENVQETVVEMAGGRRKLSKGDLVIIFDGWVSTNLEFAWETHPTFVFIMFERSYQALEGDSALLPQYTPSKLTNIFFYKRNRILVADPHRYQ